MARVSGTRVLTSYEKALVESARAKAHALYEGRIVAHRSCGIALAETFGLATPAYQSLRRGGITGCGRCGAIVAGELVLGELLGDPDPAGPVSEPLREAIEWYQVAVTERVDFGGSADQVCNNLTRQFDDFRGPERKQFCTSLAAQVAELVAEAVLRYSRRSPALEISPLHASDNG